VLIANTRAKLFGSRRVFLLRNSRPERLLIILVLISALSSAQQAAASYGISMDDLRYPDHVVRRAGATVVVEVGFTVTWTESSSFLFLQVWISDADNPDVYMPFNVNATCDPYVCERVPYVYMADVGYDVAPARVKFSIELDSTKTYNLVAHAAIQEGSWTQGYSPTYYPTSQSFSIRVTDKPTLVIHVPSLVAVNVDGLEQSAGALSLEVSLGSHTISVPNNLEVSNMTRLRFDRWTDNITDANRTVQLDDDAQFDATYVRQFQLTAESPHGNVAGAGWHDEGSNVTLSVVTPQPTSGLFGLLGGMSLTIGVATRPPPLQK
jgi:hypothetical protein